MIESLPLPASGDKPSRRPNVPQPATLKFDWREDYVMINGINTKLQITHFRLSHSRAFYLRAYLLQTHEMLFDAHYHAFQALEQALLSSGKVRFEGHTCVCVED